MTEASHSKYYDEHFTDLQNPEAEELRWLMVKKAVLDLYPGVRPKELKILDVGCGQGWLSAKLSEFGKVTGIDFSEGSIQSARKQFKGIDFRVLDILSNETIPLETHSFDLIVSSEVIEHVQNHQLFIERIAMFLKDEGVLVMTTPNGKWFNTYFNTTAIKKQPIENWMTAGELRSLLNKEFMAIHIETFYSNWIYPARNSSAFKFAANPCLRVVLKKLFLFNIYMKMLEKCGLGLYMIVSAKKMSAN